MALVKATFLKKKKIGLSKHKLKQIRSELLFSPEGLEVGTLQSDFSFPKMESEFEEEDAFTLVVVDRQLKKKKKATGDTTRKRAYSE